MRRYRGRNDSGAMAVLLAVVMVAVMVPVSGFAVTQFVRNGLQGELQRSADQGALAGASLIPLADTTALKTFLAANPTGALSTAGLIPASYCTKGVVENGGTSSDAAAAGTCPKDVACKTALTSLQTDKAYAKNYALPYGLPTCSAYYNDDTDFFSRIGSCVSSVPNTLVSLAAVPALQSLLLPIVNTLSSLTTGLVTSALPQALGSILPALLKPGITVTMSWNQRGPFDKLTSGDNGAAHLMSRSATATRAFKNVVVLPKVGVTDTVAGLVSLTLGLLGLPVPKNSPTVGSGTLINPSDVANIAVGTVDSTLTSLNSIVGNLLPVCANVVSSLQADLRDIYNTNGTGNPTAGQILADAGANATPVFTLMVPTGLTSGLQMPFLDFVPVCLAQAGGVADLTKGVVLDASTITNPTLPPTISSVGSCALNAPGLFRGRLAS